MEAFDRIKDFRKNQLKLSQEEFGKSLGVSRTVIKNMELNNLARPDQKDPLIKLICKIYNLNENWLKTGEGEMYIETTRDEKIAAFLGDALSTEEDTFKKRFLSMLSNLSIDEWELLEKKVIELAKENE